MKGYDLDELDIAVIGHGEAEGPQRSLATERVKSIVRYADPAAWTVVAAIDQALKRVEDECIAAAEQVGILLVSESGPTETIATVAATARTGYLSPLRFPAATAGSLVGMACIVFGFRGPTLNLTMPTTGGVPIATVIARRWLEQEVVKFMFITTFARRSDGNPLARCLLLTKRGLTQRDQDNKLLSPQFPHASWLLIGSDPGQTSQEGN
jgi:hypothetical protein